MISIQKIIQKIPKQLRNKYSIAIFLFIIWIVFFDNYNLIKQYKIKKNIKELEENKLFYSNEIEKDSIEYKELLNNEEERERFAREKFLMKKENEDIYIIRRDNE
ncbi:MAG: septum formation initiator family protein [Flavobacteriales bacterium]|nr:septum formation initiator family protein [Flavobacteriales bacterium]